ncbi:cobalt-precorrin 5A hydrolase [Singulisphaera acidiphila]|uniref:Cobalamin biosynthesis protein CbiG n=1 Tax=Singulisphaera acidiphila (strain ATCC BAA-1392 / DSM 18658 / VKM B-2454 / MOB10) TaxID=886293 RepID=L0D988_SINAD|nr:cobalamin biosynthesis protein [Singulisphaera acidiphila]AGA25226.1 cobalamin biosynthesis protein CbiG [Singulisphaera acidiphila DSM 18658]
MSTAILVLTRDGLALARRLRDARPDEGIVIFGPSCVVGACGGPVPSADEAAIGASSPFFATAEPGVFGWLGPLRLVFPTIWQRHDSIVAVMALGIVVRLAGPLALDKRRDPAVVVVDDAGRFAISVLGGHGAGANELAYRVAEVLGAQPVVTTASDVRGLPAVDQVGRDQGWTIERADNLTRVAASVVRRDTVAVWQDAGSFDWWRPFGPWPSHFHRLRSWDELPGLHASALLVISDRLEPENLPEEQTLVYRPPTLVAGIGCRRGTSLETIAAWTHSVLTAHGLAAGSLAALATVTLKVDEPGLLAFAAARQLPLVAFPPDQLAHQAGIETPSERVRSKIGIPAVAEPSALRASGASRLLVTKQKGPGVTVALARKPAGRSAAGTYQFTGPVDPKAGA